MDQVVLTIDKIKKQVEEGVLGEELFPELDYWHWKVLRADDIPTDMQHLVYDCNGYFEVRWYGQR